MRERWRLWRQDRQGRRAPIGAPPRGGVKVGQYPIKAATRAPVPPPRSLLGPPVPPGCTCDYLEQKNGNGRTVALLRGRPDEDCPVHRERPNPGRTITR